MANINLLPWREEQRRERNKATLMQCFMICVVACLIVGALKLYWDGLINHQKARNVYLQQEIDNLSEIIKEIEDLKAKRDELLARMQVIQDLQANRSQIVHVFDDLVTEMPDGVYYDEVKKSQQGSLGILGNAQSNGRVSALMRNLDASDWFDNASLTVVDVVDENGAPVSRFDVKVAEQKKKNSGSDAVQDVQ